MRAALALALVACAHRVGDDGALADDAVARVVRRQQGDIRACYDVGLSRTPGLAGELHLELAIEPSGATRDATIRASSLASADVERCLVDIASRWRFPSAPAGRRVSLPLVFAPEEDLEAPP